MSLITLFSAPKAFADPSTARSQLNAIQSWKRLADVDVLLLGDETGLAEAARQIGARHLPQVAVNVNGVPLISSMFKLARETSAGGLLCIVNADIILMPDFVVVAKQVASLMSTSEPGRGFVLVSQRWDLDVPSALEFDDFWEARLRQATHERGRLHKPTGSDFFLFPRGCYADVPDFAIGRGGWDNWMIYEARKESWAVIDGTASLMIVHQSHDYRHLPGAKPHYDHPDTRANTRLAGGRAATRYTILDATHELAAGRLSRPNMTYPRFVRAVELLMRRVFFFLPESLLENVARPRRWKKRLNNTFVKRRS
jgi:hypothetical protein